MSAEYDATRAAFVQMLGICGVSISRLGVSKKCIAGPIDRKRINQIVQSEIELTTAADMLREDFTALEPPIMNDDRYPVTLSGQQFVIAAADTDEQDPCVHLTLRAAR